MTLSVNCKKVILIGFDKIKVNSWKIKTHEKIPNLIKLKSLQFPSWAFNPLSVNPTKWSNTLQQVVGKG